MHPASSIVGFGGEAGGPERGWIALSQPAWQAGAMVLTREWKLSDDFGWIDANPREVDFEDYH